MVSSTHENPTKPDVVSLFMASFDPSGAFDSLARLLDDSSKRNESVLEACRVVIEWLSKPVSRRSAELFAKIGAPRFSYPSDILTPDVATFLTTTYRMVTSLIADPATYKEVHGRLQSRELLG